jgi:nicotinate-nucleotide adenylyltransferase
VRHGYFGGTFDPIHVGHLDVARAARRALGLDRVALLPSLTPPHRSPPQASGPHRFAMVALALLDEQGFEVSDLDMTPGSPSYTATTLDRLEQQGINTRTVFLITGADAFADIATWKEYPGLLDRCHFAVVSRPGRSVRSLGDALPSLAARMIDVPPAGPCPALSAPAVLLIDAATAPVSSTEVRASAAAGRSLTGLVADSVRRHIIANGLYVGESRRREHLHD